ncbi:glycosyl hydrolase [Caulobacter segnis]
MAGNISAEGLAWTWTGCAASASAASTPSRAASCPSRSSPKPIPFMTPEWKAIFRQSLDQAREAGMELGIAGSPGWSETGGPWVAPADATKKYVLSEMTVEGGRPMAQPLPALAAASGVPGGQDRQVRPRGLWRCRLRLSDARVGDHNLTPPNGLTADGLAALTETVAGAPAEGLTFKLIPKSRRRGGLAESPLRTSW